ncbi:MAG TPA: helix-turn-helix transcriptional regulator [Spirochaetota bacterium]|nr:helix-turn-helix transcriptional regulator [Spirochaetota bacterium]HPP49603.1 helix-turn-helix transcriptional regulator [Spirochaetota bacterium]
MPKYNIFDEYIAKDVKEKHNELMAQAKALFNASNILSEVINSLNKSQKEIAECLNISEGYLSRLLSGTENISLKNFAKILFKLGYELQLSGKKFSLENQKNMVWVNFGESLEPDSISIHSSKRQNEWGNSTYQKAV